MTFVGLGSSMKNRFSCFLLGAVAGASGVGLATPGLAATEKSCDQTPTVPTKNALVLVFSIKEML